MKGLILTLMLIVCAWGQHDTIATQYNLDIFRINEGYTIEVDDTVEYGEEVNASFTTGGYLPKYESPYTRYWIRTEVFPNTPGLWQDTTAHISFVTDYPLGEYEFIVNALAISEADTLFGYGTNAMYLKVDSSDVPLSIDLSFFEAVIMNGHVSVTWITRYEAGNCGFDLYKKMKNGLNEIITEVSIPGEVNTNTRTTYGFVDKNVIPGKSYIYTLESLSCSGEYKIEGKVSVYVPIASGIHLAQNYPNPFNGTTIIDYSIDDRAEVSLVLFDIKGGKVMEVFKEIKQPGLYTQTINADNIASGTYIYFLRVHNMRTMTVRIKSKKMMIIK